uniref:Uncharacterized protein n=1 Tax=Cacopsylla melanoneura TaxID=428564 RepID=A0A8D8TZA8_9HEMI
MELSLLAHIIISHPGVFPLVFDARSVRITFGNRAHYVLETSSVPDSYSLETSSVPDPLHLSLVVLDFLLRIKLAHFKAERIRPVSRPEVDGFSCRVTRPLVRGRVLPIVVLLFQVPGIFPERKPGDGFLPLLSLSPRRTIMTRMRGRGVMIS